MRVMVTGGTGFTGSHTVRAFLRAGHEVRLLVRDPSKVRRVYDPLGIGIPESDVIQGDIVDADAVDRAMEGCDAVFHAAALVDLRRSEASRVLETNARGVENAVGGAVRKGLPSVVYVSSLSVFFEPGLDGLHLELPVAPGSTAYARSKADGELAVRALQEKGAPVRVSYPCGIVGPDDPGLSDGNHAVYSWMHDLGIDTSGGFQLVDVRDLAELHLRLLEAPHTGEPLRYAVAGPHLQWEETYRLIEGMTGERIRRVAISGPVLRAFGSLGDLVKRTLYDFNFPLTRDSMEFATQWPGADGSAVTRDFGIEYRSAEESYADLLRWMYEAGHLKERHVGRLVAR